jgi:acetyltransferase-like isoleucine patch superfamily enzyme
VIKNILKIFVKKIRNEKIQIGNFSNLDFLRIAFSRFFKLIRGILFLLIRLNKPKYFFLSRKSKLVGFEKMKFRNSTSIGENVKISSIGSKAFYFGNNFSIRDYSIIDAFGSIKKESGELVIGDNVGISEFCYFAIRGNLSIGNDVIIGPGVKIFTENHSFDIKNMNFRLQEEIRKDVIIGNNVWIGANSTILSGVNIGSNVVIAAGSVVNKNIESNCIYAGVPAKFIKNLY